MKILHVCPVSYLLFKASGSAKVAYELSNRLSNKGYMVCLMATDKYGDNSVQKIVKIDNRFIVFHCRLLFKPLAYRHRIYMISAADLKLFRDIINRVDLIHMHDYPSTLNIYVARYAKKHKIPYIVQAHGSLSRMTTRKELKWMYSAFFGYKLLRDASKVIALSQMEVQQYKDMGVPEEKIGVIPNGIDLFEFHNLPRQGTFKEKYGIGEDTKVILYLGRIHKLKGIDLLIRSFAMLTKNDARDTKLVVSGPDDAFLEQAISLVNSMDVAERILFTGKLTEREKLSAYIDSSVVVAPERDNVFLLVPLEAAACGTPVIVSKQNYISRIVEEGGLGSSFEYGDARGLAILMRKMLNDEVSFEGKQLRREYIFRNFNWKDAVERLENIYQEISHN